MARQEFDTITTKDQLGKPDEIGILGPFKTTENVSIEENPTVAVKYDLTADIARWDDPDSTWDGVDSDDEWVDYSRTDVELYQSVVNLNNTFVWRFAHTITRDGDNQLLGYGWTDASNTTATESTSNQNVTFTSGQVWQSHSAFKDASSTQTVVGATLNVTEVSGDFEYQVSADGGVSWGAIINGGSYTFESNSFDMTDIELMLDLTIHPSDYETVIDSSANHNDGEFKINATAYYPFNGNANDESVNSNDGVVTGATLTTDHLGNKNNAYLFDGSSDEIVLDNLIELDGENMSVSFDIKLTALPTATGYNVTRSGLSNTYDPINFHIRADGEIWFWLFTSATTSGGSQRVESTTKLVIDTWYNIQITYNATTGLSYIYINGIQDGAITFTITPYSTSFIKKIGDTGQGYTVPSYYTLSDFMVNVGVELNATEVLNLYNTTKVHKLDKPLVTKTDDDGNSITGYEFVSLGGQGNMIETGNITFNPSTEDIAIYVEFMLNFDGDTTSAQNLIFGAFANWGLTAGGTNSSTFYLIPWYKGNGGTHPYSFYYGKVYKAIVQYHAGSSTREIYVDNVLYTTQTGGTVSDTTELWFVGNDNTYAYNTDLSGVISKPIMIKKELTSDERTALFNGELSAAKQGSDLRIRAKEDASSTGTVSVVRCNYDLS